jgi:hypothetical protein
MGQSIFASVRSFWKKYGFLVIFVFFVILVLYAYLTGESEGTYSTSVTLPPPPPPRMYSTPVQTTHTPRPDSKLEIATRKALVELFGKPFEKIRPDFLNNPVTGGKNNLEIDCFNDELKLGVEVQGVQHYKYTPFFHKNYEAFLNQKYRDQMKRYACKENNITLIEVPYTVKEKDVRGYLVKELRSFGFL